MSRLSLLNFGGGSKFQTKAHNILDYVWGLSALFAPYVFGFDYIAGARDSFVFIGAAVIVYSLVSDYWYSPGKLLPFKFHVMLDLLCGALLILAPLLFDYQTALTGLQYGMHLIFGSVLIGAVMIAAQLEEASKTAKPLSKTHFWSGLTFKH